METQSMPAEATPAVVPAAPTDAVAAGLVLGDPVALAARLETYTRAREIFVDWLFNRLVPGNDFMLIHRKVGPRGNKTECPNAADAKSPACPTCKGRATLCKPGSEKITGLLQLRPRFRRDGETWEMMGSEAGLVTLVCELVTPGDLVVAEGRGARHRDSDFGDVNKTVKMVQKSAQTDAVLRFGGLSEIFTQDLEDMPGWAREGDEAPAPFDTPRRQPAEPTAAAATPQHQQGDLADALRRSVAEAAAKKAAAESPRPAAPRPASSSSSAAADEPRPDDALSKARLGRLMALVHEAVEAADVPSDAHEEMFGRALDWLRGWVATTQGRRHLAHASYRQYDALCDQVGPAVNAALQGERRPAPRLVRRAYSPPRRRS
jgi:hypothetical protein